jgi:hypothetical protein
VLLVAIEVFDDQVCDLRGPLDARQVGAGIEHDETRARDPVCDCTPVVERRPGVVRSGVGARTERRSGRRSMRTIASQQAP